MINKKNLEKLIAKYDKQAQTNFQNYQESGITRYQTAYRKAEDLADALRSALNAEDNRKELSSLKASISQWRASIEHMGDNPDLERMKSLLKDIACIARLHNI